MRRTVASLALAAAVGASACGQDPAGSQPTGSQPPSSTATTTATPVLTSTAPTTPAFDGEVVKIVVKGGRVTSGASLVTVRRGTRVRLEVTSDVADEVHVHTYDISKRVAAGSTAVIEFTASIPGTVEVELEERSLLLTHVKAE